MSNVFIQEIIINKVRHIENFKIPLSATNKKHLIITGKNGSGKTSLLLALRGYLQHIQTQRLSAELSDTLQTALSTDISNDQKDEIKNVLFKMEWSEQAKNFLSKFGGAKVILNKHPLEVEELFAAGKYVIAFFGSQRRTQMSIPYGINKVTLKDKYKINDTANSQFIQYIVNLKADRSFARDDNDLERVQQIDQWFEAFERSLTQMFEGKDIRLEFDRRNYNFNLIQADKEPFSFNTLSDGYSALLNIVTELMLRMETHCPKNYDLEGVVLIDEIETHLHVELQKKVLPFLTTFFPKIQFIVTTHSPFVLSSIQDSVICDLEHRLVAEDFSQYSYSAILESYFETDKYSEVLKEKVARYEVLLQQETLRTTEIEEIQALEDYLDNVPKFLASELVVHWQALKLQRLGKVKAE